MDGFGKMACYGDTRLHASSITCFALADDTSLVVIKIGYTSYRNWIAISRISEKQHPFPRTLFWGGSIHDWWMLLITV